MYNTHYLPVVNTGISLLSFLPDVNWLVAEYGKIFCAFSPRLDARKTFTYKL